LKQKKILIRGESGTALAPNSPRREHPQSFRSQLVNGLGGDRGNIWPCIPHGFGAASLASLDMCESSPISAGDDRFRL